MLTSFALTSWSAPREVNPTFPNNAAWLAVSPEIGPQFPEHGAGNRAPISGKTPPPEIGAQFGPLVGGIEPATFRLQACVPPTRPNSGGQRGHTSSFATWPSPPAPARPNPKSKLQISDFGFRILDFGFRILDFGFWISDFGFWISLVFILFVAAPNGPVWILDFGFWILDFGFWILDLGFIDTVWILHKIFPNHADSGRRILFAFIQFRPIADYAMLTVGRSARDLLDPFKKSTLAARSKKKRR